MTTEPTHVPAIDVNADLGEGFPDDARLLGLVSSASICCGAHAGGEGDARATLAEALTRGVAVGAHPGFADREGFGRKNVETTADEVERLVKAQVDWLGRLAGGSGNWVRFVKPHGALYNQAQADPEVARGVVRALAGYSLPVLGLPTGVLGGIAREAGIGFVSEGFPDRAYEPDGRLVSRDRPGAVLHDPAQIDDQVARLVDRGLQTLCVHGDHPDAVRNAETVLNALDRRGIARRFWG